MADAAPHAERTEAVFFDFGGVFITSPFAALTSAAARLEVAEADLMALVFGPYDEDTDHPWHRLERGELSFADACTEIGALGVARGLGHLDPTDVLMSLATELEIRDFAVDFVRELRGRGIATGVITNNIAEFGEAWRGLIPVAELFDDIVDSCEVGMRKPDEAIYRLACERLGVAPAASLFVDDHRGNVVGAERAGLRAVWCGHRADTTRAAVDELRSLLR